MPYFTMIIACLGFVRIMEGIGMSEGFVFLYFVSMLVDLAIAVLAYYQAGGK